MVPHGPSESKTLRASRLSEPAARIARRRHCDGLILVLILFSTTWALGVARPGRLYLADPTHPPPRRGLMTRIDPNGAEWCELAQLPGVGEVIARRIVAFRRRDSAAVEPGAPVFVRAIDLTRVRGIGPKTMLRIGPYLRFPGP